MIQIDSFADELHRSLPVKTTLAIIRPGQHVNGKAADPDSSFRRASSENSTERAADSDSRQSRRITMLLSTWAWRYDVALGFAVGEVVSYIHLNLAEFGLGGCFDQLILVVVTTLNCSMSIFIPAMAALPDPLTSILPSDF